MTGRGNRNTISGSTFSIEGETMKPLLLRMIVVILLLVVAGCGPKPAPEKTAVKGGDAVCILFKGSKFKNAVVQRVTRSLEGKGYRVVTERPGNAKYFRAADYGAVVFVTDYQTWHVPRNAVRYHKRNGKAHNIVFMITAGNSKVKIKKPFDAVTSASKQKEVDRVSNEIMGRLERILK